MFKIASLLAAAVVLFSCGKESLSGELHIVSDKDVIQADGKDASTIKVMLGNTDVTATAVLYDQYDNEVVLDNGKFTATKIGEYKFYADYGTLSTYRKNDADCFHVIKAINVAVPESPADPQPQNTSFVHRAFLTQYTGTGCGYCPHMIKQIRQLMADNTIPDKAVHAAAHSGWNAGDPAAIDAPQSPSGSYPFLQVNLAYGYTHDTGINALYGLINESLSAPAKAGISVSPKYYEDERMLVVKVAVKAAEAGLFNVGAWLLEDGIVGQQADNDKVGDDSYDIHENCVRIADSKYSYTWFGHLLGECASGDVVEKTFVMNINPDWKVENLHLAVFASHGQVKGSRVSYTVCNAVDVPIDAPTPFEYAK